MEHLDAPPAGAVRVVGRATVREAHDGDGLDGSAEEA